MEKSTVFKTLTVSVALGLTVGLLASKMYSSKKKKTNDE